MQSFLCYTRLLRSFSHDCKCTVLLERKLFRTLFFIIKCQLDCHFKAVYSLITIVWTVEDKIIIIIIIIPTTVIINIRSSLSDHHHRVILFYQMKLTNQLPFSVAYKAADVTSFGVIFCQVEELTIVWPWPELEVTLLVVKGKPRDVDGARAFEHAGWHPQATAVTGDHHVGREGRIEAFAGTEISRQKLTWQQGVLLSQKRQLAKNISGSYRHPLLWWMCPNTRE